MTLNSAEAHYQAKAEVVVAVARRVAADWARLSPGDIGAWRDAVPSVTRLVAAGQYSAAREAEGYVSAALAEQGASVAAEARVTASGFVGMANGPVPPADLLDLPRIQALSDIGDGMPPGLALAAAGKRLGTYAVSLVQDAGRQADSVAIFARPRVGWVRMVNPPCCSRCAILAGRWFKGNAGFQRHPRC